MMIVQNNFSFRGKIDNNRFDATYLVKAKYMTANMEIKRSVIVWGL